MTDLSSPWFRSINVSSTRSHTFEIYFFRVHVCVCVRALRALRAWSLF